VRVLEVESTGVRHGRRSGDGSRDRKVVSMDDEAKGLMCRRQVEAVRDAC